MSILFKNEAGWILSHSNFIKNTYKNTVFNDQVADFQYKDALFNINSVYKNRVKDSSEESIGKRKKRKIEENTGKSMLFTDVTKVQNLYCTVKSFTNVLTENIDTNVDNKAALDESDNCYEKSKKNYFNNSSGGNNKLCPIRLRVHESDYLFPANCRFHCKDIKEMANWISETSEKFDLIVLDPPWWNKYIRRKKSKNLDASYKMLYNEELKLIPVKSLIKKNSIVVVWCTNSESNLNAVLNDFFPAWNVRFLVKFYWLKVTKTGEPVCKFSEPPGKQPFEQILIGCSLESDYEFNLSEKLIVSVPSALHSNKPPLVELFKDLLQPESKCLEIFARYLLPNWTSWGLEVCRFQHECLFTEQL